MTFIVHNPRFETVFIANSPGNPYRGFVVHYAFCCDEKSWGGSRKSAHAWVRRHVKRS